MSEVLNEDALSSARYHLRAAEEAIGNLDSALDDMSNGEEGESYEEECDQYVETLRELIEWLEGEGFEEWPSQIRSMLRDNGR